MIATGITSVLLVGIGIGALGRIAVPRRRAGVAVTVAIVVVAALVGTVVARMTGVIGTAEPE
ncbi:hypothetical protein [Virgisporangium aurantiacum]|uniref:Uncharacterized protein n=1 Tax=Virgisporangium aurantiacum TaxID=175570 RepID=A0A8J3Z2R8_9ACTN|nr:hypothetical protein [Virgisporangium aurantiacum]GIJ56509.1 hypothetical protein Vau01_040250 [Virgisporangium aurantiacum]